jgi:hypothetical protein
MPAAWETKDIALAAWVSLTGEPEAIRLLKVVRNGKSSFGVFTFSDPNGKIDEVIARFPNSEAHRFDAMMRTLKALGHSKDK